MTAAKSDPEVSANHAFRRWLELGNATVAAKELGVDQATLYKWRRKHPDVWEGMVLAIREECREQRRSIAVRAVDGLRGAVEKCAAAVESGELEPRDLGALTRTLATVVSTLDTMERLDSSEPTMIVEDRRTDMDLMSDIQRRLNNPKIREIYERASSAA